MGTFTMKGFPAIAIIVTAGFCRANPANPANLSNSSSEASSSCYRCPVEDKFLNGGDFFEYFRNINNWQRCGRICERTDGDGNGHCYFWSFYRDTCYLYPAGSERPYLETYYPANLPGAFSGERECRKSSPPYRSPVENMLLCRKNSFDAFRNIISWQKCGKICKKTKGDGDGNGYCSFWSFYRGTCYLYPAGADKYQKSVPGAVSGDRGCRK